MADERLPDQEGLARRVVLDARGTDRRVEALSRIAVQEIDGQCRGHRQERRRDQHQERADDVLQREAHEFLGQRAEGRQLSIEASRSRRRELA